MESKIPDFLAEQQAAGSPETQPYFLTFEDFWERKLWHQLTDSLVEFFRMPESAPHRLAIFKTFVLSFADRINQLKFVSLGLMAATECTGLWPQTDPEAHKTPNDEDLVALMQADTLFR
jgi:26S proteasome regulatory subunit N9